MGNCFLTEMKFFIVTLILALCITTTLTVHCAKEKYCQGCDETTGNCDYCSGDVNFNAGGTKGARVLSNGSCVALTANNKPTVGSEHVTFYASDVRSKTGFTSSKKFFCATNYYAYIDEVNTDLTGCYASTPTTSVPFANITGTPTTTNGTYVVGIYKSSSNKWWGLYECASGKISDTEANDGKNCSGTHSVANCNAGEWESGSKGCRNCNTGFVKASTNLTCIATTTALANCRKAKSDGVNCDYCDHLSYFDGTGKCIKGAFLKIVSAMLLALLALIQ